MKTKGKELPIKFMVTSAIVLFIGLVSTFLVLPAFFDLHIGEALFDTPHQPWMLDESEQNSYGYTIEEMKGRYHFQQYCASCHGPFGQGKGPQAAAMGGGLPNLLEDQPRTVRGLDSASLMTTINQGLPGGRMPAFPQIDEHVKETIVSYILFLRRNRDLLR